MKINRKHRMKSLAVKRIQIYTFYKITTFPLLLDIPLVIVDEITYGYTSADTEPASYFMEESNSYNQ